MRNTNSRPIHTFSAHCTRFLLVNIVYIFCQCIDRPEAKANTGPNLVESASGYFHIALLPHIRYLSAQQADSLLMLFNISAQRPV